MNRQKLLLSGTFCLSLFLTGGCGAVTGGKTEETWVQLNEAPIDVSLAEEITIRTDGAEAAELLRVDFVTDQGSVDTLSGTYTEISECARNEKDIFYVKTYAEDGAQYSYQNEIWQYEADKEENTLLYETDSGCVLLYDFDTKETYCQKITQGQGLSLRSYGERLLYMRVVGEESVALLTVQPPEERR